MNKTVGVTTKTNTDTKFVEHRNRLNGETVLAINPNSSKVIDGIEFLEVIVNGRKNLMRKEYLQKI